MVLFTPSKISAPLTHPPFIMCIHDNRKAPNLKVFPKTFRLANAQNSLIVSPVFKPKFEIFWVFFSRFPRYFRAKVGRTKKLENRSDQKPVSSREIWKIRKKKVLFTLGSPQVSI